MGQSKNMGKLVCFTCFGSVVVQMLFFITGGTTHERFHIQGKGTSQSVLKAKFGLNPLEL